MNKEHPENHQCPACIERRFSLFIERLEAFEQKNGVRPTNPDQTVAVKRYTVRAHFRRNPYHLQGDPGLKERVHTYFENVAKPVLIRRKAQ